MSLSIVYYTSNRIPERFARATREQLARAAGDLPIVSVSQQPLALGENICLGDIGHTPFNIYRQLLVGAKAAKTRYIACAEDDVLYSAEHFHTRLPSPGRFLYDRARWALFTWLNPPVLSWRGQRNVLHQMLAERELLIECLEERFRKYPEETPYTLRFFAEPGRYEKQLGVTVRSMEEFEAAVPSLVFFHERATGFARHGTRLRTNVGRVASELAPWGTAEQVRALYG